MSPVVKCVAGIVMAIEHACVPGNFTTFCNHAQVVCISVQADMLIGEACGYAVAIAFEVHQAGRGDAVGMLYATIKDRWYGHQLRRKLERRW